MAVELAGAGAAFVAAAWLAVWGRETSRHLLHTISKLTAVFVVLIVVLRHGAPYELRNGVAAALCVSMVGDFVLTRDERSFVWGLAAFLGALLVYASTFLAGGTHRAAEALVLLPAGVLGALVLRPLWPRLGALRLPVAAYTAALCLLLSAAVARAATPEVGGASALLGVLGALAFMAGDTLLAYRRFGGRAVPYAVELGTYFVAQALLGATTLTR